MINNLLSSLECPKYYRIGFIIVTVINLILNLMISFEESYALYILSIVLLGIGYYNKPYWALGLVTTIIVICRFFLDQMDGKRFVTFIVYLLVYLLIMSISKYLMSNYQAMKNGDIELITTLINALESRDTYTHNHSKNVSYYALEIARSLNLTNRSCDVVRIGGLLHDIGKIGIPEKILHKDGKLSDEEFEVIKKHPEIGYSIIRNVSYIKKNGILDCVLYHHERVDGKGYPNQLKGNDIPLLARIIAIADSYDAMTSKRLYRNEFTKEEALNEIRKHKGTQFDPKIAEVFINIIEEK